MKCALLVVSAFMFASISEAKWCIQKTTTEVEVTKVVEKEVIIPGTWITSARKMIITHQVIERIPRIKEERVCCEGYELDVLIHACIPLCADSCPKMAECVQPNTCKCHPGYNLTEGMCRLDCENCANGRCTESGSCQCNAMYVRIENECQPICRRKCINGFCAAPDVCQCNPAHQQNSDTNRCEPICKQSCGVNAYCSSPDVCSCKHSFFGNASDICQPWCKSECKNGQCLGPNNCACHQGFVKVDGLCIPDCQSGCKFGDCLDEGVCRCWPDFVYNNSTGSCQESLEMHTTPKEELPVISCVNGVCTAGISHCGIGFVKVDETCVLFCKNCKIGDCVEQGACQKLLKVIQIAEPSVAATSEVSTSESFTSESSTSESYTSSESSATEEPPNCPNGCWGGTCVNGVCQCREGLILNDENDCIMPCEATCKNGICTQDKVCECLTGYLHKNGNECVPHCSRECVNSFCIDPNHCECLEGYTPHMDAASAHVCIPTCNSFDGDEGCVNGTCVAVNKCQCRDGFAHEPGNRFKCVLMVDSSEGLHGGYWYIYLLLGLLILLLMGILGIYAIRKMHKDSYNVENVEKHRGIVRYTNNDQPYCVI